MKLSLGGVVAADATIVDGKVQLDHSMLTGESLTVDAAPGAKTFAGALVQRGEATARVTATRSRTKFGKTAELVRTAHSVSSQQKAVLQVVRNLALCKGSLIGVIIVYSWIYGLPAKALLVFGLTAVLASIPVALPAMFTLAGALGAQALTGRNVLLTRLSALDRFQKMGIQKTMLSMRVSYQKTNFTWCRASKNRYTP